MPTTPENVKTMNALQAEYGPKNGNHAFTALMKSGRLKRPKMEDRASSQKRSAKRK